jgi:SP family general alpha glucoside:H+ symporter-like MFS transporter
LAGPWHLVRKGRFDDAARTLRRLARKGHYTEGQLQDQVELIKYTDAKEKEENASTTYLDCFKGVNLRRTEIACVVFAIQPLTGQGVTGYATT